MKEVFKKAFLQTLPVMAGFLSLGIAFGILMNEAGYGAFWSGLMSLVVFAGSAQFLCVELLLANASVIQVALLVFLLNFRHFFYGLTMLTKYRGLKRKNYLIFGLIDETYAILSVDNVPKDVKCEDYYFAVTVLNHLYWVLGSVLGSLLGSLITFDMTGIDFAMTALFTVLSVEQWKAQSNHFSAVLGFGIAILSLRIFGANSFIIPALILICIVLLIAKKDWRAVNE